jgi:hypothetical protein
VSTKLRRAWWPIAAVLVIGFLALVGTLPYRGTPTKWIVCAAAMLTAVPVLACTTMYAEQRDSTNGCEVALLKLLGTILMCLALLMPIGIRLTRERRIGWSFDGRIAEKRSGKNLTIFVRDGGGPLIELDDVSKRLWERSQVGDRIQKRPGELYGLLNGQRVLMVPPALGGSDAEPDQ